MLCNSGSLALTCVLYALRFCAAISSLWRSSSHKETTLTIKRVTLPPHYLFLFYDLRRQGACLPHVMPEFLLEPGDYKRWIEVQTRLKVVFCFFICLFFKRRPHV